MTQHPKEPREPDHWMYAQTREDDVVENSIATALKPYTDYLVRQGNLTGTNEQTWHLWFARRCAEAVSAAIAATPPRIPEGFVLVPKVPTEAMSMAGWKVNRYKLGAALEAGSRISLPPERVWEAMIAAAPQAPALPETGVGNG